MTIVDALKKLYWKLGGQDKCDVSTSVDMLKKIYYKLGGTDKCDVSTSAEMVEKLADVAEAGGGGGSGGGSDNGLRVVTIEAEEEGNVVNEIEMICIAANMLLSSNLLPGDFPVECVAYDNKIRIDSAGNTISVVGEDATYVADAGILYIYDEADTVKIKISEPRDID